MTTLESEMVRIQDEAKEFRGRYDKLGEDIQKLKEEQQLVAVEIMKRAGTLEVLARVVNNVNGGGEEKTKEGG